MEILFLGVGAAIGTRMKRSCYLVNRRLLVDVGPEAPSILRDHGVLPGAIDGIIVTHLHADHVLGLPLLLCESLAEPPTVERLRIGGPADLERTMRELLALTFRDLADQAILEKSRAAFERIEPGVPIELSGMRVTAIQVVHGGIEAFGYRVEDDSASLFISGDTVLCEPVERQVAEADFSLLDATSTTERLRTHMNLDDLRHLESLAGPSRWLFAVHRSFETADCGEHILLPRDGDSYRLERGRRPMRREADATSPPTFDPRSPRL